MAQKIVVSIRNVYGRQAVYPACPTSAFFAALAGTTILTYEALRLIRAQGYEVVVETPKIGFAA